MTFIRIDPWDRMLLTLLCYTITKVCLLKCPKSNVWLMSIAIELIDIQSNYRRYTIFFKLFDKRWLKSIVLWRYSYEWLPKISRLNVVVTSIIENYFEGHLLKRIIVIVCRTYLKVYVVSHGLNTQGEPSLSVIKRLYIFVEHVETILWIRQILVVKWVCALASSTRNSWRNRDICHECAYLHLSYVTIRSHVHCCRCVFVNF